ncbi:MAG: hypothetical protein AAB784_01345 [Patescibacteria group bacterium]
MHEQLKIKSITLEEIDAMDPKRVALAWENFLKRLGGDMREDDARKLLEEELREFSNNKNEIDSVVLWGSPEIRVTELKLYLLGEIDAVSLRTYEELSGGNH